MGQAHDPKMEERALRRLALAIVIQLPESADEALLVLDFARELMEEWMVGQCEEAGRSCQPSDNLVQFRKRFFPRPS